MLGYLDANFVGPGRFETDLGNIRQVGNLVADLFAQLLEVALAQVSGDYDIDDPVCVFGNGDERFFGLARESGDAVHAVFDFVEQVAGIVTGFHLNSHRTRALGGG